MRQVMIEIVEKMHEYNISLDKLMGRKPRAPEPAKEFKEPKEVKYRDPETGATWSGRGRAPQWIAGNFLSISLRKRVRRASRTNRAGRCRRLRFRPRCSATELDRPKRERDPAPPCALCC